MVVWDINTLALALQKHITDMSLYQQNPAACLRAGYHRYQTGTAVLRHPTSSSMVLNKAQHCRFFFFLKWQYQQFPRCSLSHTDVQPWEKAKWQGIQPVPTEWLCDGWAGDKGRAGVPFRWHLAVCSGLRCTAVVVATALSAASRTEGDSKPTLRSLLPCSSAAVMWSRGQKKDQGLKRGKRDTMILLLHSHCSPVLYGSVCPITSIRKYRRKYGHSYTYFQA